MECSGDDAFKYIPFRIYQVSSKFYLLFDRTSTIKARGVKLCQIRYPDVRIKYPDTSGCSHRISQNILKHLCYLATPPGLYERPIIFRHDFGSDC